VRMCAYEHNRVVDEGLLQFSFVRGCPWRLLIYYGCKAEGFVQKVNPAP